MNATTKRKSNCSWALAFVALLGLFGAVSASHAVIVRNVLTIVYDPDPGPTAGQRATYLNNLFAQDLEAASIRHGYNPASPSYTGAPQVDVVFYGSPVFYNSQVPQQAPPCGPCGDYNQIIDDNNVCDLVNSGAIDEVWIWANNGGGLLEAVQAGIPGETLNTNGGPLTRLDCSRPVDIMGFNFAYSPDDDTNIGVTFESFAHRTENLIAYHLDGKERGSVVPGDNWYEFDGQVGYDGTLDGNSYCGNAHWAPNATLLSHDYDLNLTTSVMSDCENWNPQHTSPTASINCNDWGCNRRGYFLWWFQNMPGEANGLTKLDGSPMPNWWELIMGNSVAASCTCTGGSDYWGNPIDPATTYCGMQVCGGDDQYYECTASGWNAIGGAPCSTGGGCTCTGGSDFWGNPIDPASTYCGMQVCGGDNQYYECTASGWNAIGGAPCATGGCYCAGGSDYWGNPIDPATTYCGMQVCGGDNQYYECTGSGWSAIGGYPCASGSCTCTGGVDYWGNPIDPASTYCGMQVCGGDNQYYECTASGWSAIGGSPCAGGGGGGGGVVTAHCGSGVPLPSGHTGWSPAGPCEGVCYSGWTDGHCTDPADSGSRIDVYGCAGKTSGSGYSCDGNTNGGVLIGTYSNGQQIRFSDFLNTNWCTLQIDVLRPSASDPVGLRDFLVWERDVCP